MTHDEFGQLVKSSVDFDTPADILYAPDDVVNAGGMINIACRSLEALV